ncbi:hypothetical protein EON77_05900 [bacterium]|nr:MAG: hypothetical protein EON77_05900 [bacterium]
MKLVDKGHHAPAPRLVSPHAQRVAETLASWKGVNARTHWYLGDETVVDGADFYLGEEELGHIHLEAEAHVALPPSVVEAVIRAGLGRPFRWSRGFVVCRIDGEAAAENALWLFALSLACRAGTPTRELLARVEARSPQAKTA